MNNEQLTEIQYCEDCENCQVPESGDKSIATCTEFGRKNTMLEKVCRELPEREFCLIVRTHELNNSDTCDKFKGKLTG